MRALAVALLSAASLVACAAEPVFPMPMTAEELVSYDSGDALVAYLSQPDASLAVCDARSRGPHMARFDEDVRAALVDGLAQGRVPPARWLACTSALLGTAPREDAIAMLAVVGRKYRSLVKDGSFESTPAMQERVGAMQKLYLGRSNAVRDAGHVLDPLFDDLRGAIAAHKLGHIASWYGTQLLAVVDLERGTWKGKRVDEKILDDITAEKDEETLRLFALRLPKEDMREAARRRIVRLHVAASPFREVKADAMNVEDRVLIRGANPISTEEHSALKAWLEERKVPVRGVLVQQDLWTQQARLVAYRENGSGLVLLPELDLRGMLMVEAAGISLPITICAPPADLDPSPCLAAAAVHLENPLAYLDRGGVFRFVDGMRETDAVGLASMRDRFAVPVSIAGRRLTSFVWSIHYQKPQNFVASPSIAGVVGPPLVVHVNHRDPARYVFDVSLGPKQYWAVVEAPDARAFAVASQGAQGTVGASGSTGSSGSSGSECSSGGPGGPGSAGGPGGPGGDGGDVYVEVDCGGQPCGDTLAMLHETIVSLGGAGGPGGSGGAGGSGGSGGPGRSQRTHTDTNGMTVVDDPGCSAGSQGASGSRGSDGPPGQPGQPGRVTFRVR